MQLEIPFPSKFRSQRTFRRICIRAWFLREPGPVRHSWNEILDWLKSRGIRPV